MTIATARFDTRREAEMAIERLVQTHGFDRSALEVVAAGMQNSAGIEIAGADAKRGEAAPPANDDAALNGRVEVRVSAGDAAIADAVFREFHAADSGR